jgi:putative transposase
MTPTRVGSPHGTRRSLSPFARARSWEPLKDRNPTFAVGRKNQKAFFARVALLRDFRARYRECIECWRAGIRDVVFPAGTWWMNVFHAVAVGAS